MAQCTTRLHWSLPAAPAQTIVSERGAAIGALIAANLVWGASFVATKPLLHTLPPATLTVARLLIALAVLLPALKLTGRAPALGKGPALLGVTGISLFFLLQNVGLDRTSATNASILQSCVPVITLLIAFFALREKPAAGGVAAVAISMIGALTIVLFDAGGHSAVSPLGDGLILASAFVLAGYFVIGRRLFAQTDVLALVTGSSLYGLLVLLPASASEFSQSRVAAPDVGGWLCIIYLGVGASALAFCMEGWGLRHLEAGQVALFTNLGAVIGIAAAAVVLGETLTITQLGGALLVIAGAWLATRQSEQPEVSAEQTRMPAATGGARPAHFRPMCG